MRFLKRLVLVVIGGFVLVVLLGAAIGSQPRKTEVERLAAEAGVSAVDLEGAANATGLSPRAYLESTGELAAAPLEQPSARWLMSTHGRGVLTDGPAMLRAGRYSVKYRLERPIDRDNPSCLVMAALRPANGEGKAIDLLVETISAYGQAERSTSVSVPQDGEYVLYSMSSGCEWHVSAARV